MYQLKLIAMPFMNVNLPSLALTQLKAITKERFPGQVAVDICYLNHDFAHYFRWEFYHTLSGQAYKTKSSTQSSASSKVCTY